MKTFTEWEPHRMLKKLLSKKKYLCIAFSFKEILLSDTQKKVLTLESSQSQLPLHFHKNYLLTKENDVHVTKRPNKLEMAFFFKNCCDLRLGKMFKWLKKTLLEHVMYRKVVSTSPSCFEAHEGLFRLLMKEIFDAYVQGPPTHIDAFQTNIFSWFNDTVIQSQRFLGLWDREIWYKTFSLHQPHMASMTSERKYIKDLKECGHGAPMGMPRPGPSGSK